jgi:hypothetical protein
MSFLLNLKVLTLNLTDISVASFSIIISKSLLLPLLYSLFTISHNNYLNYTHKFPSIFFFLEKDFITLWGSHSLLSAIGLTSEVPLSTSVTLAILATPNDLQSLSCRLELPDDHKWAHLTFHLLTFSGEWILLPCLCSSTFLKRLLISYLPVFAGRREKGAPGFCSACGIYDTAVRRGLGLQRWNGQRGTSGQRVWLWPPGSHEPSLLRKAEGAWGCWLRASCYRY